MNRVREKNESTGVAGCKIGPFVTKGSYKAGLRR